MSPLFLLADSFFEIFEAAMNNLEVTDCRHIPAHASPDDLEFLKRADLVLLAGGDSELGWTRFRERGIDVNSLCVARL